MDLRLGKYNDVTHKIWKLWFFEVVVWAREIIKIKSLWQNPQIHPKHHIFRLNNFVRFVDPLEFSVPKLIHFPNFHCISSIEACFTFLGLQISMRSCTVGVILIQKQFFQKNQYYIFNQFARDSTLKKRKITCFHNLL